MSDEDKEALIAKIELQLEELTGTHFYAKNLDYVLNGNGKNRLFLPLRADLITVTELYICESELSTSWYNWDDDSVYLDLCQSGAAVGDPELLYRLGEADERGLFPRGYNNIRVVGTYGQPRLIALAKQAVEILIKAHNDGSLYTKLMKAEKIGDYSYQYGGALSGKIYTGIREADEIIDLLLRDKPVILTP